MEIAVDLHLMVFWLMGALAVLSGLVHFALRRGSALAWLSATMVCVGAETLVLRYAAQSTLGIAAIVLLLPAAYFCAAQAVRLSMKLGMTDRRILGIAAALTGLSLLLLALRIEPVLQFLPFQLAGAAIFLDAVLALARHRNRGLLGHGLLILCCFSLAGMALRMPMFPLLLGQPTPYPIMEPETFKRVFVHALSVLSSGLAAVIVARIVANEIANFRYQSERDSLTGLLSRRVFDEVVDAPAAVAGVAVMCDIDHFKTVNDRFGHHVGDDVIRSFACILSHHGDYIGRVGGEEFALLLHGVTLEEAVEEANAIRTYFHEFRHPSIGHDTALSASFGVAPFVAGHPARAALQRADDALYKAKRDGRNRVCAATEEPVRTAGMQYAA